MAGLTRDRWWRPGAKPGASPGAIATGAERPDRRVQVISRPGCHLCQEAVEVVAQVCDAVGMPFEVTSVAGDDDLEARFGELVPVILVDGREVARYRITASELEAALIF